MKKIIFLVFAVILTASVSSYSQGFDKGVSNVNVGLAVGYGIGLEGSYDIGIAEKMSVGVGFGATRRSNSIFGFGYGYKGTHVFVNGRFGYHFGAHFNDWFGFDDSKSDPYVGASVGPRFSNYKYDSGYTDSNYTDTDIVIGGFVGYRYALSDKFAVFAEVGSPTSSAGITLKL